MPSNLVEISCTLQCLQFKSCLALWWLVPVALYQDPLDIQSHRNETIDKIHSTGHHY